MKIWIISDMTDSCQEEGVRDWELVFGLVLVFCVFFLPVSVFIFYLFFY